MGEVGKHIYFIANGDCQVTVSTHVVQLEVVKELHQGDYFGEIAVIFGSARSSNVDSINYCTLAHLHKEHFKKMWNICPEMYTNLKENALQNYNDDWMQFKTVLLQQVDYFKDKNDNENYPYFFKEIQFYMEESIF